jgi:hypothetical protein
MLGYKTSFTLVILKSFSNTMLQNMKSITREKPKNLKAYRNLKNMLLDVTRQSQPKCTGSTQEIPRQQKQRI